MSTQSTASAQLMRSRGSVCYPELAVSSIVLVLLTIIVSTQIAGQTELAYMWVARYILSEVVNCISILSRISTAVPTHDIDVAVLSVCPSVCLSHSTIVLK